LPNDKEDLKNQKQKYHSVGTEIKSNRKIIEEGIIDTLNTHIHHHIHFWPEMKSGTSIN
jgi:hypothetical protein